MDREIVDVKLKRMIIEYSNSMVSDENISAGSDLINDLGYDSVRVLRLLAQIEKEFGITFKDEDLVLEVIGKFGNLKNYICALI